MSTVLIYMTAGSYQEAERIGQALVQSNLAACINILDPMHSLFWWQNEVQSEQETVLLAKSRADLVDSLTAKVRELHSYECPCVVALPICGGNPEFIDWIQSETQDRQE